MASIRPSFYADYIKSILNRQVEKYDSFVTKQTEQMHTG